MRIRLLHWGIIVFCVWHMFSVLIFIIPDEVRTKPIRWTIDASMPYVRPYMYVTSQWQKWNIFSPDPIRRVSAYELQIEQNGVWQRHALFRGQSMQWQFRTKELKILRQLEDSKQIVPLYLADYCRTGKAPANARLKLKAISYVIPTKKELEEQGGWPSMKRNYWTTDLGEYTCPPAHS